MKRLLPLLDAIALPTAVSANLEKEVHKRFLVDWKSTKGMGITKAVSLIKGPKDKPI